MRTKTLIISTIVTVAVLISAYFMIWSLFGSPEIKQKYMLNIARNVDSQAEENALSAAESINYSDVNSFERFNGRSNPEDYLHPGTYLAYTFANYIDATALNYYQVRYDSLQGKGSPRAIEYSYSANVSECKNFVIYNSPAPYGVSWHNTTMVTVKTTSNGSVASTSGAMPVYVRNQTGYQLIEWEYEYNFTDCYVVQMNLEYSEVYAPTAAFFSTVHQIVVLDRDFSPLLIGIDRSGAVS